jgi:hypothetical protein
VDYEKETMKVQELTKELQETKDLLIQTRNDLTALQQESFEKESTMEPFFSTPRRSILHELEEYVLSNLPSQINSPSRPSLLSNAPQFKDFLHSTQKIHDKLSNTDPVVLNRKLGRSFDLPRLTTVSNTMIRNLIAEIELLVPRFEHFSFPANESEMLSHFLESIKTVVKLLVDIGQLKLQLNAYSLAYFQKMVRTQWPYK